MENSGILLIFRGKSHVKFGHFVKFSCIFSDKNVLPPKVDWAPTPMAFSVEFCLLARPQGFDSFTPTFIHRHARDLTDQKILGVLFSVFSYDTMPIDFKVWYKMYRPIKAHHNVITRTITSLEFLLIWAPPSAI